MDYDFEALERRMEFDKQRLPIEEKARGAQARGDFEEAAALWERACELALRSGEDTSRWYVEGQLSDALIKSGQLGKAKKVLEASIAAGSDIPFAHSLLVDIYVQEGAFEQALHIRRESWRSTTERAQRHGMPPIDPSPDIVAFAKWWKDTSSITPIALAEKWAEEAQARNAWFAVRHERALMLEKQDADAEALELYLELIRQGTRHDATYTRAMIGLDGAKRTQEALALAHAVLGLGLSASLEEQARKRIIRLETKLSKDATPRAARAPKKPKDVVPSFSIRSGETALTWLGQVEVKGGFSTLLARSEGVFATGGTDPHLWWIGNGTDEPQRLRAASKRSTFYTGAGSALVTDEGTVREGSARVEMLGPDWATTASFDLPGVTSDVAVAHWGLGIGCRAGSLYATGWDGVMRWQFAVPQAATESGFGSACPYHVSCAADSESVVFSSFTDVYAVAEAGRMSWKWQLPSARSHGFIMMGASVSAVRATSDGGAWVGAQTGEVFRLNGQGKAVWNTNAGGNIAQLITDSADNLVAVVHSGGLGLLDAKGGISTAVESKRWPRATRSTDGRVYLLTEGKVLQVLDARGQLRAVVEFSKSISEAGFVGSHVAIAAGKIVTFGVNE